LITVVAFLVAFLPKGEIHSENSISATGPATTAQATITVFLVGIIAALIAGLALTET